jgi:hypothetical protein
VLPLVPPRGPPVGSTLSSTGSSGANSPASTVLWRCATPWTPLAALGCLRPAIPCAAPVISLPSVQVTQPRARGSTAGPHRRHLTQGGQQGLPSSRETSTASMPGSSTPAGLHAPYRSGAAAWPPREERRGLPHWDFRSSIARPQSSLSTLRRVGCPTATQDSLPGAGSALLGGLDYPQGFAARFQRCTHIPSPSPRLLGASPFSCREPAGAARRRVSS